MIHPLCILNKTNPPAPHGARQHEQQQQHEVPIKLYPVFACDLAVAPSVRQAFDGAGHRSPLGFRLCRGGGDEVSEGAKQLFLRGGRRRHAGVHQWRIVSFIVHHAASERPVFSSFFLCQRGSRFDIRWVKKETFFFAHSLQRLSTHRLLLWCYVERYLACLGLCVIFNFRRNVEGSWFGLGVVVTAAGEAGAQEGGAAHLP